MLSMYRYMKRGEKDSRQCVSVNVWNRKITSPRTDTCLVSNYFVRWIIRCAWSPTGKYETGRIIITVDHAALTSILIVTWTPRSNAFKVACGIKKIYEAVRRRLPPVHSHAFASEGTIKCARCYVKLWNCNFHHARSRHRNCVHILARI